MKITKVSITGADDKTNTVDLRNLQNKYPFVEWAILFSASKRGEQRYPELIKINSFLEDGGLNLAAHFCGWYAKEVLEQKNYQLISDLNKQFKRIQINYNFKHSKDWDLDSFLNYIKTKPEISFILQYNQSNSSTLNSLLESNTESIPQNLHFLFDASGGRGTEIKDFKEPFKNLYTGYAGGINSKNILSTCMTLSGMSNDDEIWIDMESGVRTDDNFDLEKVETVLDVSLKFIK